MTTLCRNCDALATSAIRRERCDACGSPRQIHHTALHTLLIVHADCDAFYGMVEKRDRPDLAGRPVIIGGGARGVVLACCCVARLYGVRSAMPMFKALAACPDAVVMRPDMAKYRPARRPPVPAPRRTCPPSRRHARHRGDGIAVIGQLAMLGGANSRPAMAGSARIPPGPHAARTSAASRRVPAHSISAETTPPQDDAGAAALAHALWPPCQRSRRA